MSQQSLKNKTVKSIVWNGLENVSSIGLRFLFGVILARILSPSEYGIIGMLTVFLAVSDVFVNAGFGSALIRKPDRTESDNSTAFYFNIVVALVVYVLLFLGAPLIAHFYNMPLITPVLRLLGISVVINSFSIVQNAILAINLEFKKSAGITFVSVLISGAIGVFIAYRGFGVYALVWQTLSLSIIKTILLWLLIRWRPIERFSKRSFQQLFGFGSKLLVSGLLETIYTNIYPILIGKLFSPAALGLYSRASSYAQLPSSNLTNVIQRVTFPVLSKMQDDDSRLSANYRKLLKMSVFIIFPCMMLLFGIADPLIRWMLTDKWEDCIYLLQILCFSMMWFPVHAINLNLLQVKGRSDLFLKLEIAKKIIGVVVIIISCHWGVIGMCYGAVFSSLLFVIINTYYTGKLINVGYFKQMADMLPILTLSIISGVIVCMLCKYTTWNNLVKVIIGSSSFFIGYALLSRIICPNELTEVINIIRKKIN